MRAQAKPRRDLRIEPDYPIDMLTSGMRDCLRDLHYGSLQRIGKGYVHVTPDGLPEGKPHSVRVVDELVLCGLVRKLMIVSTSGPIRIVIHTGDGAHAIRTMQRVGLL